ncbi:allantoate deiminase [Paenibacillus sanguinis]|uniref:allantoate deiminase n=1 Tax=Paenibacillus sanguinis TaxID=225906 RepID=UPI00036C8CA0|nr:allantoate deiminase [Paenibacillus sanguinis]
MNKISETQLRFDPAWFEPDIAEAIDWLAAYGSDPGGGVTRLLYSPAWQEAQTALAGRMEKAGLATRLDDCGNLFGRLEGSRAEQKTILTGSHVDTVRHGGKYDGAYGILAGILALEFLRKQFGQPLRPLEVVSLCEEEGSRFPLTYWGSGNLTGRYAVHTPPDIADADGTTLQSAMNAAGFGLGTFSSPRRSDIARFIELHVEQGFVLERERASIGIVQGIVGQRRYTVRVCGSANHAGTTPMKYRQDALLGACEMIEWLERKALHQSEPFVSTVGQLHVKPNSSNVIPGDVSFTVDIRDAHLAALQEFSGEFPEAFARIAARRGLKIEIEEWMNMNPFRMNDEMNKTLAAICHRRSLPFHTMFSGAGHDTQVIGQLCPATMLFVPSRSGISHSPHEYSAAKELAAGIAVLTEWLYYYGYTDV